MGLQTKFILCVALILVAVMTTGGVWFYQHQEAEFFARVRRDMDLTQAFVESTRSYARDVLRPAVDGTTGHYVAEAQSASVVARGVFDRFAARHPNFHYKEATDNPLNPANAADAFEADLLRRLRADRSIKQLTTFTGEAAGGAGEAAGNAAGETAGREWYVSAKPVVADASCLKCHASPDTAPAEVVARYGTDSGYGWNEGDVVAAAVVRVPTGDVRTAQAQMARRVGRYFGGLTTATLLVVFLAGQVLVRIPVRRMSRHMAEVADGGHYDRPLPQSSRRDELGTAAAAFNRVLAVVSRTLGELRSANETLERRVDERTNEIRRSHRHMELLRESSLDAIISMDADGRVTDFNPAAEATFGYSRKDVVGKPLADLIIPSHLREAHRHGLAKYLSTGKGPILGKRIELTGVRSDGREVPVELAVTAVLPEGSRAPVFTAYIRDVSDRKRRERSLEQAAGALQESEERYRVLAEALPQFVWTMAADGKLESVNRHWQQYTGLTTAQTTDLGWWSALHPDDVARSRARWEQAKATGVGYEMETRFRRASDGAYLWHHARLSPVRSQDGKSVARWVGVATDIHDRRDVEETLRRSEQRFRLVAQCATDVIYEWDLRTGWLVWHGDIDALLGYAKGQFPRTLDAWLAAVHPDDRERVKSALDRHVETREPFNVQYRIRRADGTYVEWSDRGTTVWDDAPAAPAAGAPSAAPASQPTASGSRPAPTARTFVGAITDITDRRRAEIEQRRAEGLERERTSLKDAVGAMEQVLGVVGHELRTPLAGLRAMSEYMLTDAARATAEFDQFLSGIHDEVVRMSDTVNDLLEAARLNSGRARWNWSTVALEGVCRDALDTVRPLVDESRVRLGLDVIPAAALMAGDADAIRRLVLNLLNNARKHTTDGEIRVSVRSFERGRHGFVRLCVRDTGTGIVPEIAARLGEAFMLNSGVVGEHYCGGTGLGLAICKGVAAAHGGALYVESTPGKGTEITAEMRTDLPRAAESAGQVVLASAAQPDLPSGADAVEGKS